jgi:hypothetical protein
MLIQACASAGIMHHSDLCSDHGPSNMVVEKMIDKVLSCELAQGRENAHQLLCEWGDMMREDCNGRNKHIEHGNALVDVINQQSTLMLELQKQRHQDVHVQQQQNISIADLSDQVHNLQELFEGQEKRKSPTKLSSTTHEPPPGKRSRVETAPAGVSPVAAVSTGGSSTISSAVAAAVVKRTLHDTLRHGSKAASVAADSNKDIELRHVLIELRRTGQCQNRTLEDTMHPEIADNNMSKHKAVMRLVEKSWTLEQQEKRRTKSLSDVELMNVAVGADK